MLTENEKKNFEEAISDVINSILNEEKELDNAKKCLEYMKSGEYVEKMEKQVIGIIEFHINDLNDLIKQHNCEKDGYNSVLKEGRVYHI